MKLIVGLGNPGEKYKNTRHNVGFMFIEFMGRASRIMDRKLSDKFKSEIIEIEYKDQKMILFKPKTFMNESGKAVSAFLNYEKILVSDLIVVHDDLDLRLGEFKIQLAKGPKIHYGVNSIEEQLGTKDFMRVRIGVDNRNMENRTPGEAYVLQNLSEKEREILQDEFVLLYQAMVLQKLL